MVIENIVTNKLNANSASEIVRKYFIKITGERRFYDMEWIDALDFKVIKAKRTSSGGYEVICEMRTGPFSNTIARYDVLIDNDGIISSVEKEEKNE